MIISFGNKETRLIWEEEHFDKTIPKELHGKILRLLIRLNNLEEVSEMRIPPGLNLKKLTIKGKNNYWSIRVNDKYRICFLWDNKFKNIEEVMFIDYH